MLKNRFILFIVSLVMFMESVDTTIINTSIPIMAKSLNTDPLNLKLALISYLLSLAIFIPISGWVADRFGTKKVFMIAVGIFTLSSIACGFSANINQLIVFRMLQGMGSSISLPIGRLIILRSFKRHEIVSNMGFVIMIASLGSMLGPFIGGMISSYFCWRWIFWVNAPFGALTIILAWLYLPRFPKVTVHALDKLGFILFGLGLSTLTFGLSSLSDNFFSTTSSVLALVLAGLLLLTYALHSKNLKNPIVRLDLFEIKTFKISMLNNTLFRIIIGGIPFMMPLMLQINLGLTPQISGLLLAPIAIGVLVMKSIDTRVLKYFGYKKILRTNCVTIALSLWSFTTIENDSSLIYIALLTFIFGFVISLQYASLNSLAYANIQEENLSSASSMMSTTQQVGLSFGVAFAAILLRFLPNHDLISLEVFHAAFLICGSLSFSMLFSFKTMSKEDGMEMIQPNA